MSNEIEVLADGVKDAEALKKAAYDLVRSGAVPLDAELAAGLQALNREIGASKEVLRG